MEKVHDIIGNAIPLNRADVDTDQIMPKQFLKRIERSGFGPFTFFDWRKEPDFVLNNPAYANAPILIAQQNFGCGSSREHAPWALQEYGFRAIIAPSYGDIFFNNSLKNGLLPIVLDESKVDKLFYDVASFPGFMLEIDLERQTVTRGGGEAWHFDIEPFTKYCLLNGLDDIGLTLRHADKISAYEAKRKLEQPWLFT